MARARYRIDGVKIKPNRNYKRTKRARSLRQIKGQGRKTDVIPNPNPLENEVILPDSGTTQASLFRLNDTPVILDVNITVPYIKQEIVDPVISQTLPCHTLTTQDLQFRANDTPVHLDANITVPYIKQEIVEQVVSQTPPCHILNQEMLEPIVSQTLPCHTLIQSFPVTSSSLKPKVVNITKRILPERSSIDLPYDAVCRDIIDEPVPGFLPEQRHWIVKNKVLLSTGGRNGKTADICGVKRSDVGQSAKKENAMTGNRLMTLGEANCTSNKLHKTCYTSSSSANEPKPQLDQSIKNSTRNLLIRPAVPNVSSHSILSGELIPSEKIEVEDEFEVVENEFHESPEAAISNLNQKWNSSLSGSCLNPVTTRIVRSPSTRWFLNSCTPAITTETVTTFASTSDNIVCTNTSALSTASLSSTSTTPILISSYPQPSIPNIQNVSSLPINPALNVPMIHVPQWPTAKSNPSLIFNSLLPKQSNQSSSMVTNLSFVANNLNNSCVTTIIRDPSSNVNSSLPIQTVVLNPTINSTLCDINLSSTSGLFGKDADFLPDKNTLSDTKSTTLLNRKRTTLSLQNSTSLSNRISTILFDRKSITPSDRNNATLSDRNNSYVPDRNTNMLFDRDLTMVARRCSKQRRKALRRRQYHMMEEQKKIWLLGKMYKKN